MTLENYTLGRWVALPPDTSAYAAIRAMDDNHIGAVVVLDDGHTVGIVTDRDLALQVISYDRDPMELRLRNMMAKPVQVIQRGATAREAAESMLERGVRRLPILDGSRLVGMVTLDDLIADQAVPPELLAAIVRAQLAEPARLKRAGERGPSSSME